MNLETHRMNSLLSFNPIINLKRFFGAVISIYIATQSSWAHAQDLIFTIPAPQNESYADIGIAGITRNTYVGSDETEERIAPYIKAEYKGRVFFKPGLGAGVYAIRNEKFRLSASGNLAFGRDTEDTPFNNQGFDENLLEINSTVTLNIAGRYYLPFGAVDVISAIPVGGDLDGQRVDALFTTEIHPVKKLRITPGVRATYQSSGWINSLYGVNDTQADTLGINEFSLDGQFSTIGAHAVGYYELPQNLELIGFINYSRLLGDTQDSPLVAKNNGLTAAIGIAKKF